MKKATFVKTVQFGALPGSVYRMEPQLLGCEFVFFAHSPGFGFIVTACGEGGGIEIGSQETDVGPFSAAGDEDKTAGEVLEAFGYETEGGPA